MKPKIRVSSTSLCLLASALFVAPCSAQRQGYVMNEWNRTFRELGIVPVFPPREDIQVGDMYLFPYDPDSKEAEKMMGSGNRLSGVSPRWDTLNVMPDIVQAYMARPPLPKTPDAYLSNSTGSSPVIWQIPTLTGVFSQASAPDRLRLVAFPAHGAI